MNRLKSGYYLLFFSLLCSLCTPPKDKNKYSDTPTTGEITVAVDGAFFPLMEAQVEVFNSIYQEARIQLINCSEDDAIRAMIADSARLAVVTRELNQDEIKTLASQEVDPTTTKIAVDGVALILHPRNPDSLLVLSQVEKIFTGKIKKWNDLGNNNPFGEILLVFDSNRSSNLNYIKKRFKISNTDSLKIYAMKSNEEVVEYVSKNENALGVIGTNWISDVDDQKGQQFLAKIAVMGIASSDNARQEEFYRPYQAYLYKKKYPLSRDLLVISREGKARLGLGFTAFVTSDRGQRIVLKDGILPATMPIRLVELKEE